jgi:nucleoside-diphosphate-sugar epimerase
MKSEFRHIAIIGGLGHIGSGWVRILNSKFPDIKITIVDNLLTQRFNSLHGRTENISKFVEADASSDDLYSTIEHVDIIFHFAAISNMNPQLSTFKKIKKVNIPATKNIINTAKKLDNFSVEFAWRG